MDETNTNDTRLVVGIPTYNNEDTIERTIAVFESQTVAPTRLVFCDGSTDQTPQIIEAKAETVEDFEITLLEQDNDGVADAYNQILEHLDGEYDIFGTLQTDFEVEETWVENAISLHADYPDIGIINAHTGIHRELEPTEPPYFSGRCFTAKSGVLEGVDGWDENFLRGEDWDIRIRLTGADVSAFGTEKLSYTNFAEDPPITISKALRKPTSAMYLAKYGIWYAKYHPSHVIADGLGVLSILGLLLVPLFPPYGIALTMIATGIYLISHNLIMGDIEGSQVVGVIRKAFLDGLGFLTSAARLATGNIDWNMKGFSPDNIPRQDF